jgi:hypothetical protein
MHMASRSRGLSTPEVLAEYLAEVTGRRWQFGSLDCCTFMADWLVRLGMPDPMADRRGTYSTHRQYRTLLNSEGGLLASCERRFTAIGLEIRANADVGNVAIVLAPAMVRHGRVISVPAGAICVSGPMRAVITPDRGLVIAALPTLRVYQHA